MKVGRFTTPFQYSMLAVLVAVGAFPSRALAQDDHMHAHVSQPQNLTPEQKVQADNLVRMVQDATDRFHEVGQAEAEGYQLQFGCVSGPDLGAMGLHFVNMKLVNDGELKPESPEIVLYEPLPNGRVRLTGADYLIPAAVWDAKHPMDPPQLNGQLFHLFDSPNRFGLPAFYTLHVWAWKENPNGTFTNWNPNVSCDAFIAPKQ